MPNPTKYALTVDEAMQDLAVFLNDGRPLGVTIPRGVLMIEINGPCEITTKLEHPSAVYDESGEFKDEDVIHLIAQYE